MSFFDNPIANISGGIHDLGKGVSNLSKNPLVDALAGAALMAFAPETMGAFGSYLGADAGAGATMLGTGVTTGGIAALASGNLGQGLKAGLAAYGGAGAENYLSNMGTTAAASSPTVNNLATAQLQPTPAQLMPSGYDEAGLAQYAPPAGSPTPYTPAPSTPASTSAVTNAIKPPGTESPGFFKSVGNWFTSPETPTWEKLAAGAGGISLLKAAATPQKLNAPAAKVGNIRQYSYNPYTGQMTAGPITPANQFTGPVTAANYGATGGLVALARGGSVQHYCDGGTTGSADAAPQYTQYTPTQMANYIQTSGLNTSDPVALAAAVTQAHADPAAVQAFLASSADPYSAKSLANPTQPNVSAFDAQLGTANAKSAIDNAVYAAQLANGVPGGTSTSIGANTQIAHEMDNWNVNPAAMGAAVGMSACAIQALYNQVNPTGKFSTVPQIKVCTRYVCVPRGGGSGGGGGSYTGVSSPTPINTAPPTTLMPGVGGTTGPAIYGGGTVVNPNGTITTSPVEPGIPVGGWTGMANLQNEYVNRGGSLGYTNPAPTSMDQFNQEYNTLTGGSQAAYDFLMGKTTQPKGPAKGPVALPYFQAVGMAPKNIGFKLPNGMIAMPQSDGSYLGTDGNKYNADGSAFTPTKSAGGGLMGIHMAMGGMTPNVGHLGGYSDGGRLLRGPGDGVSDSIPATIGSSDPEPARLADGEFVVPARIVSELGNGSTEAGARQLYKMMDRIQTARRKTTGKDAVATNTNAHQYLPA